MNVIISSWPGAGGTTTSVLLANIINFRYFDADSLPKLIAKEILKDNSESAIINFEKKYAKAWEPLWEKYLSWKVKQENKFILDNKTAGFYIEDREKLLEIMLIAEKSIRKDRLGNVSNQPSEIIKRDEVERERWMRNFKFDIYNVGQIELNYDLVIDTSIMGVEDRLVIILDQLYSRIDMGGNFEELRAKVKTSVSLLQQKGLNPFVRRLQEENLFISPQDAIPDIKKSCPSEFQKLPKELRKFMEGS